MDNKQFLLYGANGYTSSIIYEYYKKYNLTPILAGRNKDKIEPIAKKYNLPFRIFDLDGEVNKYIDDVELVLNYAGPFTRTAKPLINACLETGTHYLDITGEIEIFEYAKSFSKLAEEKGIILMPGVGFDVVPTDCLSLFLKNKLPDATHLELAFAMIKGSVSHGTATTASERLGTKAVTRKDGKIVKVPVARKGKYFDFDGKKLFASTIQWGDISTAYTSTGIPNIDVYSAMVNRKTYRIMKWQFLFNWILRMGWVKRLIKRRIDDNIYGPDAEKRAQGKSVVIGEVSNKKGDLVKAQLVTREAYDLTAHTSLLSIQKIYSKRYKGGYYTPSLLFGHDFILEFEGSELTILD